MIYLWRISDDYPQSLIGEYQREGTPDRFRTIEKYKRDLVARYPI